MKSLAALSCAALLAATVPDAQAAGSRFSRASSGGGGVAPRAFHHHPHSTVIFRGAFIGWPGPYYWPGYYYGPGYYYDYGPPAVAPPAPAPLDYLPPAAGYHPLLPGGPVRRPL